MGFFAQATIEDATLMFAHLRTNQYLAGNPADCYREQTRGCLHIFEQTNMGFFAQATIEDEASKMGFFSEPNDFKKMGVFEQTKDLHAIPHGSVKSDLLL